MPSQSYMKAEIEALAINLGLAPLHIDGAGSKATIDTPFDLEMAEDLPAGALEGLEFGYG